MKEEAKETKVELDDKMLEKVSGGLVNDVKSATIDGKTQREEVLLCQNILHHKF